MSKPPSAVRTRDRKSWTSSARPALNARKWFRWTSTTSQLSARAKRIRTHGYAPANSISNGEHPYHRGQCGGSDRSIAREARRSEAEHRRPGKRSLYFLQHVRDYILLSEDGYCG